MLKLDLRKYDKDSMMKFKSSIGDYINKNIDKNSLFVSGVNSEDFLEKVSIDKIIYILKLKIDELLPRLLRDIDGREILTIKIDTHNYNGYNLVDKITEISMGTFQLSFATGTIFKTIKLGVFDKDTQDKLFNEKISGFSKGIQRIYLEIYDELEPIYRSFDTVNDMILQSISDSFKNEYDISKSYELLEIDMFNYIKDSQYSDMTDLILVHKNKKNGKMNISLNKDELEISA